MRLAVLVLVVVIAHCLAAPLPLASAAAVGTGGYAAHSWPGCGGGFNSGSWDIAGRVYVPCGNPSTIGIYDTGAHLVASIPLDFYVSDVAPTRDGAYLYLATGSAAPRRLVRGVDGAYALDPTWSPATYTMWGSSKFPPRGYFVATDAAGRLYLSDGYWSPNSTHAVVVYEPSGRVVGTFGEWKNSWDTGTFYWALGGVAVNDAGTIVYTAEAGNNRIQTWRLQPTPAGGDPSRRTFEADAVAFGGSAANNADREGYCDTTGWLGKFAAPYDVALDASGNIYVINTTCKQLLSFSPGFAALRANVSVAVGAGTHPRPHGFAVGHDGTVYVGENQHVLRPEGGTIPADSAPPTRSSVDPPPPPTPPTPEPAPFPSPSPAPGPAPEPAPSSRQPIVRPSSSRPADRRAPFVHTNAPSTRTRRRVRQLRVPVRCSERCTLRMIVRQRGRVVAIRTRTLAARRMTTVSVPLRFTARPGALSIQLRATDRAGNARTLTRRARLR